MWPDICRRIWPEVELESVMAARRTQEIPARMEASVAEFRGDVNKCCSAPEGNGMEKYFTGFLWDS